MTVLAWITVGLLSGAVASGLVDRRGDAPTVDILLGVAGAVVGGFVFNALAAIGVSTFNVWSLFVSGIGAVVVLLGYNAIARWSLV